MQNSKQPASINKRALALVYDSFLLLAILLFASLPAVAINQGEALDQNWLYRFYLLAIAFLYFSWNWKHGGQTLAMSTWKIKFVSIDNKAINWQQCLIRFCCGLCGLMIFSALFNPQKQALHDRLSNTLCIKVT